MRILATPLMTCLMGCAALQPRYGQETAKPTANDEMRQNAPSGYPLSYAKEASNLPSRIALCNDDEPGEKMILTGTVYEADGVTPAPDAIVYLYQTDVRGVYSDEECNDGCPKLRGYLKTDPNGGYEVRSMRPGLYPHIINAPAHIHVHVEAPHQPEYGLLFQFHDDPRISDQGRARSDEKPPGFGLIRLSPDEHGILRGVKNIKLPDPTPGDPTPHSSAPANPLLEEELRKIMLEITIDIQHGSPRVYSRYAGDVVEAGEFTYSSDAGEVGRAIPIIPAHPLEKRTTEIVDVHAREHGDAVILNYRQLDRIERKDHTFTKPSRKTVVFVRRDGNWQVVSYDSSPIAFGRVEATVDPKILDSYGGKYENPLWGIYDVSREGNALVFTSANGYRTEYLPESETEFFLKDKKVRQESLQTVTFVRNENNTVTHYVVRENDGRNIIVKRIR